MSLFQRARSWLARAQRAETGSADRYPRRVLTADEVSENPHEAWNAFIDVVALCSYDQLSPEQRPALLTFLYNSEVNNGGHFQYFLNKRLKRVPETISALETLGAGPQAEILARAFALAQGMSWDGVETAEQYVAREKAAGLDEFDSEFYAARPSIDEIFERHHRENQHLYVLVEDAP